MGTDGKIGGTGVRWGQRSEMGMISKHRNALYYIGSNPLYCRAMSSFHPVIFHSVFKETDAER